MILTSSQRVIDLVAWYLLISLVICANSAAAERYALLVGANIGIAGDEPLRYATADVERMSETLQRLGGFDEANILVLTEPQASQVRQVLSGIGARLKLEHTEGSDTLLLVYYSGHADSESLHLNGTQLPWQELRTLTANAAATARLLIVDACRSGQVTNVKGSRLVEPFALPKDDLPEGIAIISSATAGEVAQESHSIGGSFFSHHLMAAMAGAGDVNRDGRVTLSEAYRYAAERTVSSTAQTMAGVQHPTYLYELKGRRDLVLTRVAGAADSGHLLLSQRGQYLIRAGDAEGPLVFEVSVAEVERDLWLPAGAYLVRQRLPSRLHEYRVTVRTGAQVALESSTRRTLEYTRLAMKGNMGDERLLVLPLRGASLPAAVRTALEASLAVYLDAYSPYGVTTMNDINSQLKVEAAKDTIDCHDVWCATEVAGAVGARFLLEPVAYNLGSHFTVTMSLMDVHGATAAKRAQGKVPDNLEYYEQAVDTAARRLFDVAEDIKPAVATAAPVSPVAVEPTTAPDPGPKAKPVYTKWWFWAAVTGGALVTGGVLIGMATAGVFDSTTHRIIVEAPEPSVLLGN